MATKTTDASKGTDDKKAAANEKAAVDESVTGDSVTGSAVADEKVEKVNPDKTPAAPVSAIGMATAATNNDDPQFEETGGLIFSHVAEESAQSAKDKADKDADNA